MVHSMNTTQDRDQEIAAIQAELAQLKKRRATRRAEAAKVAASWPSPVRTCKPARWARLLLESVDGACTD